MKVLSLEFTFGWSWGLIVNTMSSLFTGMSFRRSLVSGSRFDMKCADVILCQNITQLNSIKERGNVVCRLGGNRSLDDVNASDRGIRLGHMAECWGVIATNKHLFDTARQVNDNVFLVPNGLDLNEWKPREHKFVVGFAANISTPTYREYKG